MDHRFTEQEKENIVAAYAEGQAVVSLCAEHSIPRSTLYSWVKRYDKLKSSSQVTVSYNDYYNLKRRAEKLVEQLNVLKAAGCGTSAPLKEKLFALERLYGKYSVHALCEALDVSRGTFYNHIFRRKDVTVYDKRREEMKEKIKSVFEEGGQRFGAKKVSAVLSERGDRTSPKYVSALMSEMGLQCVGMTSKREYKKKMKFNKKQNILQRQFNATAPNLVWVSDVTCFKVNDRYFYICVILDLFSRKVIAHGISMNNTTYLVTSTFKKAFDDRGHPQRLTFHSDRGVQYTSYSFQKLLRLNKVVQSFSKSGSPHDNAVSEAFFASMKKEELYRTNYKSENDFRKSVEQYIRFYNYERPHSTLAYKSPDRFEREYGSK